MSQVRQLHDKAMKLAQQAMIARQSGDCDRAEGLAREAYRFEQQAADLTPEDLASEPTRSILYRSAASLAYQCKELHIAQRLIAKGLSGYPPPEVEQQLKDLYAQINFEEHLKLRGVTLSDEELQLALDGKAVGSGIILFKEFMTRIKSTGTLIDRTVQRLMNKEYQGQGRPSKMFQPFTQSLSTGRVGSFAITIKLGYIGDQMSLLVTPAQVIEEVIIGMELINNGKEDVLRERIPNRSYFNNFLSLARQVAPDGDKINLVGFTSTRRAVALTRPHDEIEVVKPEIVHTTMQQEAPRTPIEVEGLLDIAIGRGTSMLGLMTDENKNYEIIVAEGLEDLVRAYFKQVVRVKGEWDGKHIYLSDLSPSEE